VVTIITGQHLKKKMRLISCLIGICCSAGIFSQSSLSAEFVGLTVHPAGDAMAQFQPNKLDKNARFVMNYGVGVTFEKFLMSDVLAIRALQVVAADCSAGWASVTQLALKGIVINKTKHRLGLAIGPAFLFRESWNRFEGYSSSGFMKEGHSDLFGEVQYKFFPLVAEVEYDYSFSDRFDLTVSMTPALPMAMTFAAGFKYWFNKDFEKKVYLPRIN
jgi:hypothetical protein